MQSPLHAQIWELWRTSRAEIGLRLGAMLCFLLIFLLVGSGLGENENRVIRSIVVMVSLFSSIGTAAWASELDKQQFGFRFRLGFARPISTMQLVLVPILYTVVVSISSYLFSVGAYAVLMGTPMPFLGPVTLLATLVTCFFAVVWSPSNRIGKWIATLTFGTLLIAFCVMAHRTNQATEPFLMILGSQSYWALAWPTYWMAAGICFMSMSLTVISVTRQRRGDAVGPSFRFKPRLESGFGKARSVGVLRNPFWAQCWYESRRVFPAVLLLGLIGSLVTLGILTFVGWLKPAWQSTHLVWSIVLVASPLVYQLVSIESVLGLKSKNGIVKLSVFDATRAMRCDQLIGIKLLVVATASFLAWTFTSTVAALHLAWLGQLNVGWQFISDTMASSDFPRGWWFFGVVSVVFSYVYASCMLLVVGMLLPTKPKMFAILGTIGTAHLLLAIWDAKRGWHWTAWWTIEGYVFAFGLQLFAALTIRKSLASYAINVRWFSVLVAMWIVYATSTLWMGATFKVALPFEISPLHIMMTCAGLLMPLVCVVIAPLTLASFRHR